MKKMSAVVHEIIVHEIKFEVPNDMTEGEIKEWISNEMSQNAFCEESHFEVLELEKIS